MDIMQTSTKDDVIARLHRLTECFPSSRLSSDKIKEFSSILTNLESMVTISSEEVLPPTHAMSQIKTASNTQEMKAEHEEVSVKPNFSLKGDESNGLAEFVAKVKNKAYRCSYVSSLLAEDVKNKDKNRCKGRMTSEVLWRDEYDEHISTSRLLETACSLWQDFPDLFEQFDQDREIDANQAHWNAEYLVKQSNYLRHNFALERLCHLILVYNKLYGNRDTNPQKRSTITGKTSVSPHSSVSRRASDCSPFVHDPDCTTTARQTKYHQDRFPIGMRVAIYVLIAILIFIFGVTIGKCFLPSIRKTPDDSSSIVSPEKGNSSHNEEIRIPIGDKRSQVNENTTNTTHTTGNSLPKTADNISPEDIPPHNGSPESSKQKNDNQLPTINHTGDK